MPKQPIDAGAQAMNRAIRQAQRRGRVLRSFPPAPPPTPPESAAAPESAPPESAAPPVPPRNYGSSDGGARGTRPAPDMNTLIRAARRGERID